MHQNAWVYNGGDCIWAALVNELVDGVESTYDKEEFRAHLNDIDLWRLRLRSRFTTFFTLVFVVTVIVLVVLFVDGTLAMPSDKADFDNATAWSEANNVTLLWDQFAVGATSFTAIAGLLAWSHVKAKAAWTALATPVTKQFFGDAAAAEDPHFTAELGMMGRVK